MKVYLAKIQYPYEDDFSILGIYSSEENAQIAIDNDVKRFQKVTNNNDRPMNDIEKFILDNGR